MNKKKITTIFYSLRKNLRNYKIATIFVTAMFIISGFLIIKPAYSIIDNTDTDNDGVFDNTDNCVYLANSDQSDTDNDRIGNTCDNCRNITNSNQTDADRDGIGDACDNCPTTVNQDQSDINSNGVGDACESVDTDGDGIIDSNDNCPLTRNPDQTNDDGDTLGNACDPYNCIATGPEICGNTNESRPFGIDDNCDGTIDEGCDTDQTAPVSSMTATYNSGEANYVFDTWINKMVTVSITADDNDGSGVDKIYYCLSYNNDPTTCQAREDFSIYNNPMNIGANDENGIVNFKYYAKDKNGNMEDIQVKTIKVDKELSQGGFSNLANGADIFGNNQLVQISYNENYSGVKNICVLFGDSSPASFAGCSNEAPYSIHWNTTNSEDRTYKAYVQIEDNAGNIFISDPINLTINNARLGTESNPAIIRTCQDFQNINKHTSWYYKLENNIDCSATRNWNNNKGFLPIPYFTGTVDGQGYTVSNLYMDTPNNSGVFDTLSSEGKITSINLRNVNITCGSTYCGVLTYLNTGTIEKTSITGRIICNGQCGGYASQNSGTVSESWADLNMRGSLGYAGILFGHSYHGQIINCYAKGKITSSASGNIGGLAGLNEDNNIVNSYSTVVVSNGHVMGGMLGWQYQRGTQTNSYWDTTKSGKNNMCGSYEYNSLENCLNENGLTDEQMKIQTNFSNWDFENTWAIDNDKNEGYPYLKWQTSFSITDLTKPTITLLGNNPVNIYVGDTYNDAGATATDNVDGNITASISTINQVNTSLAGNYLVTYNVKDNYDNEAEQKTRTVNVLVRQTSSGGSSSGGGGSLPSASSYCSNVSYGEWGVCTNGFQYRDILNQTPNSCLLTTAQQLAKTRSCVIETNNNEPLILNNNQQTKNEPKVEIKKVLGEKKYANGTLLRDSKKRIYVIINGKLKRIRNLFELRRYYFKKHIIDVKDEIINQYEIIK